MILDFNVLLLLCGMNIGTPAFDYQLNNIYAMNTGSLRVYINSVLSIGSISAQDIEGVNAFYDSVPYCWFVPTDDHAARIVLQEAGMHNHGTTAAMGVNLDTELPDMMRTEHIQIKEVDAFSLDYIKTIDKAFEITDAESETIKFNHYILERAGHDNVQYYVAYYDGIPVSTALSLRKGANVGLFCVGTDPEYRCKGCGLAICHRALSDAKGRGAKHAWLLASDMGYPVYKKLGFVEYEKYEMWGRG